MFGKLDEIIADMRKIVSEFCLSGCRQTCCDGLFINSHDELEVRAIFGIDRSIDINIFEKSENRLKIYESWIDDSLYYHILLDPCPQYNGKCNIYNHPNRPLICKEFPIAKTSLFVNGYDTQCVNINAYCMAVKNGIVDEHKRMIENLGVQVNIICDSIPDSE